MNKTIIEQYIKFAHTNWFRNNESYSTYWCEIWKWDFTISYWYTRWTAFIETKYYHFIELITSKPFIESIARGIYMWDRKIRVKIDDVFNKIIDNITIEQAKAIRDNTLEDYIINLWISRSSVYRKIKENFDWKK